MRDSALNNDLDGSALKNGKRQKLIEAAIDEFNEYGIDNASYNRIIERSGISKGSVYYHFENKDALLNVVMEEIGERVLKAVPEGELPETREKFWESLWDDREKKFDFFSKNPALGHILIMSLGEKEPAMEYVKATCVQLSELIDRQIRLIKRGQELGAVRGDISADVIFELMRAIDKTLCYKFFGRCLDDVQKFSSFEKLKRSRSYAVLFNDLVRRMLETGKSFN